MCFLMSLSSMNAKMVIAAPVEAVMRNGRGSRARDVRRISIPISNIMRYKVTQFISFMRVLWFINCCFTLMMVTYHGQKMRGLLVLLIGVSGMLKLKLS